MAPMLDVVAFGPADGPVAVWELAAASRMASAVLMCSGMTRVRRPMSRVCLPG